MRIAFIHTPMAAVPVPLRQRFWQAFDIKYHAAHPGLRHMRNNLWELPHWMPWLAGVLEDAGFDEIEAVDFYSSVQPEDGLELGAIRDTMANHPADVYLFSPMTPNLPFAYDIAGVIKELYPTSITVFGGVVATPLRRDVAQHASVDYVVFDRGEYALPALLKALVARRGVDKVRNICCKRPGGGVYESAAIYPHMPVELLPAPKFDMFAPEVGQDIRYLRAVYALGCPYKCSFCTIQTIGRKPEYFPVRRVLGDIHGYRARYGSHHNVYFGDETFTLNEARTLELCAALKADGTIKYDCQTRLNCLGSRAVLNGLAESGCRWVEIGIETINQASADIFKQRIKIAEIEDSLKRVQDAGLRTCAFMVNGFPNQSLDDMRFSLEYTCGLIDRGLLTASYLFGLVPYPGSSMYEHPEAYGMTLLHRDFRRYHEEMPPVYATKDLEPDAVYGVFLEGVESLGQAMARTAGAMPANEMDFGTFWQGSHV